MRVLVTGAGGYIGIPLCEELARRGHEVIAADRWFFGRKPTGYQIVTTDIRSISHFEKVFSPYVSVGGIGKYEKPHPEWVDFKTLDAVIDLAGLSNDASADIDPDLTRSINLEGGKRLATMAKQAGVRRYVYSSSASVYGHGGPDLTEDAELKPLTLYARCKTEVEDHIRSLDGDGFETVILRNATVFGVAPRMRFDLVANIMALTAWRDHQIMVRGGEQWRPLVHVKNVVEAFVRCVSPDWTITPGTYNVGHVNMTMNELARNVSEVAPWAKIVRVPEAVDTRDYHISFARAGGRLSDSFPISPLQGVAEIITALRNEEISADDPTCYTLRWYQALLDWDKRLADIRLNGKIL